MYKISTDVINLGNHLLNKRTGDLYELTVEGKNIILSLPTREENEHELFTQMLAEGVIVDSAKHLDKDTFHVQWHLLNSCNLQCTHCYDWKEKVRMLTYEQMLDVVDRYVLFLKQMGAEGELSLTGGEPLLFRQLIPLMEYIKSRDVYISLYVLTNGTIINNEFIEAAKKYSNGIQISIDGKEKEHDAIRGQGSFKKSFKTIKILQENGINPAIHYVLMKKNKNAVIEFIDQMRSAGIATIHFSNLIPIGPGQTETMLTPKENKEVLELIAEKQKETDMSLMAHRPTWCLVGSDGFCPVGFKTLTINAAGKYMACRRMDIEIGDARRDSFFKVWFDTELLNKMRDRRTNIPVCGTCEYAEKCGGCRALAYAVFNDPFAPDPSCWIHNQNNNQFKV